MTYTFDPLVPRPIDLPTAIDTSAALTRELSVALDEAKIFSGPTNPAERDAWRARLDEWRRDARERHGFVGTGYENPNAQWAAQCRTVAQVWLWDELLYSFDEHRFTPERLIADAQARFDGLDAVVLWHAYPIIGVDDRNQWDYYRDIPGLRRLVDDLHAAGLKVFVDYNPWDIGTRRAGADREELAAVIADFDADGVFLDTLKKADPDLVAALNAAKDGIVLEGESKLAVERTEDHTSSWAQFFADSEVPGVLRAHWYERRHMQHHVRRWHRDHSEELQSAWLNGVGVMVWEVVFGVWVGWSERDANTLRRLQTVTRAAEDLLLTGAWTPLAALTADAEAAGVYASSWEKEGVTLFTLVNRGTTDWTGVVHADHPPITVPGRSIAAAVGHSGDAAPVWFAGLEAAVAAANVVPTGSPAFAHRIARRVLAEGSSRDTATEPSVLIASGEHVVTVRYRARETGMYQGAPYVDEFKPLPPRLHDARTLQREVVLHGGVRVAQTEVTNRQFAAFVAESGYVPAIDHRYLLQWQDGAPAAGTENEPVTFVNLDDARAYAAWRGARLATEDEWQLAGADESFQRGTPRVWNWTESEYSDGRTRFVMLKGGADYIAEGSDWYIEGGPHEADYAVKFLRPGLGLDRSATIGFRLAWDEESS
ncbi:hypothetical protein GCM10009860_18250 [Microbacterium mitrae]|uniref:Formylglycine-generating enzyme family protein n=1 Tax=Microbacterium mitrae TaxID=664640 RepID=A0A5C8HQA1_9MICO|nr:SUMF1/EgtB/PvdO family nonheme iron enzyme [Microbacterium mitrae]TXK04633.1 formylglycine-generating enzyme family protein [Microbacterium mitrae]